MSSRIINKEEKVVRREVTSGALLEDLKASVQEIEKVVRSKEIAGGVSTEELEAKKFSVGTVEDLIPLLKDKDRNVRLAAVNALDKIGLEETTEHLIPLLGDDDREVRLATINTLGRIGLKETAERLISLLNWWGASDVHNGAILVLGKISKKLNEDDLYNLMVRLYEEGYQAYDRDYRPHFRYYRLREDEKKYK